MMEPIDSYSSAHEYVDAYLSQGPRYRKACIQTALAFGSISDVVEIVCIGFILSSLGDGITQAQKEFLGASMVVGLLFGGFFAGQFCDKCGRRFAFQVCLAVNGLSALVSAFSPNITALIICRVVTGIGDLYARYFTISEVIEVLLYLGIGGLIPIIYSICSEVFCVKEKDRALTVLTSCGVLGSIFAAVTGWICLGDDSEGNRIAPSATWRTYAVICSLPAFAGLLFTYFLVETPIYLLGKGKRSDAAISLTYLSNYRIDESDIPTIENNSKVSVFSAFLNPYLYPMSLLCIIWFTFSFSQFGLLTWVTTLLFQLKVVNPYSDACIFAVISIPGYLFSLMYMSYIGRGRLLCYSLLLCAICVFIFGLGYREPVVVILCMCFYSIFSVIAWNALCCLSSDSYFPSSIRGSAMGYAATSGRIGGILAQFFFGSFENNIPFILFSTSAFLALGGLAVLFLPQESAHFGLEDKIHRDVFQLIRAQEESESSSRSV